MEIREEPRESQTMAEATDSNHGTAYINLSYTEKAKYHGQGFVYHPKTRTTKSGTRIPYASDTWQIEWSSGTYKPSGRIRYNKITLRGTGQQARDILDIIVQVQHRPYAEASAVIEPYIEWRKVPRSGVRARYVKELIPSVPMNHQIQNRERIIRDYQRLKLLDIMVNLCRELGNYECEGDGVGVETTTLRA
jgi:hypothetical protein